MRTAARPNAARPIAALTTLVVSLTIAVMFVASPARASHHHWYHISDPALSMCVDNINGSGMIWENFCEGEFNRWTWHEVAPGQWEIHDAFYGACIATESRGTAEDTRLVMRRCNYHHTTRWKWIPLEHGLWQIRHASSNRCMSTTTDKELTENQLVIKNCTSSPGQQWLPVRL